MTYSRIILPLALLTLCLAAPIRAATLNVAVIDLKEVFEGYYKTRAADASLKERAGEFDKEKKTMLEQYQALTEAYKAAVEDANNQAIAAEERERRKKAAENKLIEVREMEQAIQQFDRQALTTLDEQERRIRAKLLEEIQVVVETKAKAGKFSLVIDTAAETRNKTPMVLFTDGQNNLTSIVLTELNATAPPEFLKPGTTGRTTP